MSQAQPSSRNVSRFRLSETAVTPSDDSMLVATLVWFTIAIARRAPRDGVSGRHPNEGSSGEDAGR